MVNEATAVTPTPSTTGEPYPSESTSREQLERDTYDVREKSSEQPANVA